MGRNLIQELIDAAQLRIQTQGEFSADLMDDLVDELIDEFMRDGLITDDDDTESLKAEVINRLKEELNNT